MVITCVVFVEQSQRRIPCSTPSAWWASGAVGGASTYIPLKVNMAGVIPIIFASSMLTLPTMLAQFAMPDDGNPRSRAGGTGSTRTWRWRAPGLHGHLLPADRGGLHVLYVSITFNPEEVSNMKRYGGFIPGIRAGRPARRTTCATCSRAITLPGALYLGGSVHDPADRPCCSTPTRTSRSADPPC
ncbi:SecY family transport protein [Kocuria rhizophila]|nr:SecY family transport protein [Kocuria rhizophila]